MDAARLRPHHSRTHSQANDYASDYQSSDDGYDYNIVDDAPEAQATKPKELDLPKPRQSLTQAGGLSRPDVADNVFTETMPHIFQRNAGGRRAKIPTDVEVDLEKGVKTRATGEDQELRKAVPEFRNIKLSWTMPEINSRRVLQLNYDKADVEFQEPYLQQRRVRWQ